MRARLAAACLAALAAAGPAAAQGDDDGWSGAAALYVYPGEDPTLLLPIVTADRGALHLEGRWNYEDRETGSAWLGWSLEAGNEWRLTLVPMLGLVFGRSDGVAPGLEATLAWRTFELYSETEVVVPLDDADGYLYTWSQLTWAPTEGLALGVSTQRLRAAGSDRVVDAGPMAVLQLGPAALEAYLYNPFSDDDFAVLGASIAF